MQRTRKVAGKRIERSAHHSRAALAAIDDAADVDWSARRRSWRWRMPALYLLPALALVGSALAAMVSGFDFWMADRLYALQGGNWVLRHSYLATKILHPAGRDASTIAWICVLVLCASCSRFPRWSHHRRPLACLAASVLLSTLLVSWIKSWSNVDCPWDLLRYGGERAYSHVFSIRPENTPGGACFPAGHASGGYAWMAAYFYFLAVAPTLRWRGLAVGISLGMLFGILQQLRGAHFVSHDLATAAVCWLVAVLVYACAGPPMHPELANAPAVDGKSTWMVAR